MKKSFFIMIALMLLSVPTMAQRTRIPIKPDNGHQGHKSPETFSYLPTVVYDDEAALLSFEPNADLGLVPYSVIDENDNVVLSGYIYIYMGTTPTVSVSSLPAGDYTLTIEVSGTEFIGEFTV